MRVRRRESVLVMPVHIYPAGGVYVRRRESQRGIIRACVYHANH